MLGLLLFAKHNAINKSLTFLWPGLSICLSVGWAIGLCVCAFVCSNFLIWRDVKTSMQLSEHLLLLIFQGWTYNFCHGRNVLLVLQAVVPFPALHQMAFVRQCGQELSWTQVAWTQVAWRANYFACSDRKVMHYVFWCLSHILVFILVDRKK